MLAATTPVEVAKREAVVGNSLANNSTRYKKDLQDKLFEQIKGEELKVEEWLKKELGEEDLYKCMRVWREFETCKLKPDKKVEEYIDRF